MSSIQKDGKSQSVFDSPDFCNGFINFASSEQYEKYMEPFLNELIEAHRTKLESVEDFKDWQSRLKAIRFVQEMPEVLKARKAEAAEGQ